MFRHHLLRPPLPRLGRLLRYQQALLDDVENATEEAIALALDELSERWDIDL